MFPAQREKKEELYRQWLVAVAPSSIMPPSPSSSRCSFYYLQITRVPTYGFYFLLPLSQPLTPIDLLPAAITTSDRQASTKHPLGCSLA